MPNYQFSLNAEEMQDLIKNSAKDKLSCILLTKLFNELMKHQRDEYVCGQMHERTENRNTYRNGFYNRKLETPVGTLYLNVPRTRDGKFSPTIFEKYQRHEKALLLSMLEMYIEGVSTRKVSQIVESLCGKSVSKSFVSSLTKMLDEEVNTWKERSLGDKKYRVLMTDVFYIKIRENHCVVSKGCHIALGICEEGKREIIGYDIQGGESEETWSNFFNYLKRRGLTGVELVISDAHSGLVKSITKEFPNASWQRCAVHFMRNILNAIPKKYSKEFMEELKSIMSHNNIELARKAKNDLIDMFINDKKYTKACEILDNGFEDAFQYLAKDFKNKKFKSSNMIERLNEEIRRREKVIRIFPNVESANRLVGSLLIRKNEKWMLEKTKYINFDKKE